MYRSYLTYSVLLYTEILKISKDAEYQATPTPTFKLCMLTNLYGVDVDRMKSSLEKARICWIFWVSRMLDPSIYFCSIGPHEFVG